MIDRNTDNPPHGVFHAEGCEYSATLYRSYIIWITRCLPSQPSKQYAQLSGLHLRSFFADGKMIEVTPELEDVFESWIVLTPEQKEATRSMMRAFRHEP